MTTLSTNIARWIEDGKLPHTTKDFESTGANIGQCIPPIFDTYCKIFHPFELATDESDILEIRNKSDQKKILTQNEILKRREEWLKEYNSKQWSFVNWETIADKYGLIFHNQINQKTFEKKFQKIGWQKNLIFPNEGHLARQLLVKLLNILKLHTASQEAFIYQIAPHTSWKGNKAEDLVKCNLEEVLEYFNSDFIGYLFAADKSWLVFTDTDLTYSIVGGQRKLIDGIIDSDLEAIECTSMTRVDDFSDNIN
ncbi:hypothetical protein [Ferruginibacter albus]|uniref:hypothetical protein n=1 Tax=Ferruginibacter albus TaxID=2875540 RepID=UPI001CC3A909|nr:hypothetical protein [Ferruginibacter albus]UAY50629.1 hypothetical protein K9M53_08475 [Ferruginibacter albus]